MAEPVELSIVIVNFNGKDLLRKCLKSIYPVERSLSIETIVVDNGSTDGSQAMIASEFPHVRTILNQTNKGFSFANNQAIRQSHADFVLLLNSDTEIIADALSEVLVYARLSPQAGIIGCRLVFDDLHQQRSVHSFPTPWNIFCEAVFLNELFPNSRIFGRYSIRYFDYGVAASVDWISGAFFLIKRNVINSVGLLDEGFFMYSEEMDYCLRAKQLGFETWYTPVGTVIHHWLTVSETTVRGIAWLLQSQLLFFRKHFAGWKGEFMVATKYFGILLRLIFYPVAAILTRDRRRMRQWTCLWSASRKVITSGISVKNSGKHELWHQLT